MIKKYIKKPVIVEAVQWDGDNEAEIKNWAGDNVAIELLRVPALLIDGRFIPKLVSVKIHTLEGVMEANVGDYIIKGTSGEFYPCKANIFEDIYGEK